MIRRLRWKVVAVNMLFITAILTLVFAGVYRTASVSLRTGSEAQLHAALQGGILDTYRPGQGNAAPCFVAEVYPSGTVRVSGSSYYDLDDEQALQEIIEECLDREEDSGVLHEYHLRYLRKSTPLSLRIAFTDSSLEQSALRALTGPLLLLALAALAVLFACSYALSGLVTRPVERAWKNQQRFISDASHELKTPLTVILSSLDLLEDRTEGEARHCADNIRSEARRMRSLVESMLTLSRLEDHRKETKMEPLNLGDLVMDAALRFEPVAFEAGRTLHYAIEEEVPVRGNAGQLQELCGILLDNAIKYAPAGGDIGLRLSVREHRAEMTVENGGDPIPPEKIPHLFERFYRSDDSRSGQQGFGLGLAIAKTITEEHGGTIACRSDAERTAFTVHLPLHHSRNDRNEEK